MSVSTRRLSKELADIKNHGTPVGVSSRDVFIRQGGLMGNRYQLTERGQL